MKKSLPKSGSGSFEKDFGSFVGDVFENFIGKPIRRRTERVRQGADLRQEVELSLEDAYKGTLVQLSYERLQVCSVCGGSGAKRGTGLKRCAHCGGTGHIQFFQDAFSLSKTCPSCGGAGRAVESPCQECRGTGRVRKPVRLSVRIPQGVRDGAKLRIPRAGEAGSHGSPPGDLYLSVRIKPHPKFKRDGDNLIYRCAITFPQAALGAEILAPTLTSSKARFRVPPGSCDGTILRIHEQGMTRPDGHGYGDLLVELKIQVPQSFTPTQRNLLEKLAATMGQETRLPPEKPAKSENVGFIRRIFGR